MQPSLPPTVPGGTPGPPDEATVIETVRELLDQMQPGRRVRVRGASTLDRDLGLDSLGRVELLLRLQKRFGVTLPEKSAFTAETVQDLLKAVAEAGAPSPASAGSVRVRGDRPAAIDALPFEAGTLVEVLAWHAGHQGARVHLRLDRGTQAPEALTYAELLASASRVAAGVRARALGAHPTVALMLPTSRDFFVAFFGVLLAGGIPVPIYPPFRLSQLAEHLRRQSLILRNAEARLLIATPESTRFGRLLHLQVPTLTAVGTVSELAAAPIPLPAVRPEDVALVQYTSGSTGDPKGVVLTHANLLANIRAMGLQAELRSTDTVVSWLPLYHDMGLIGAWLGSLYHACPLVVMPPAAFLTRPERWLWALHEHRGSVSAAPNFAYELAASRVDEARLAGLDLSSWRLAFNGSEPVSPGTIERFTRRFARYGFPRTAMTPVYGLAEGALGLTFPPAGRGPRIERVDGESFARDGRAVPTSQPGGLSFVSSGLPLPGHEVRVVDARSREVPERVEGRIQFRGPSATSGYLRNPVANQSLFDGEWLETGDLGYFAFGELFVTGRAKDVIIRAGRHLFPYDLEQAVAAVEGVRKGGVAAFAVSDESLGTERLVIVAETMLELAEARAELRGRIDAATVELLGAAAEEVVLVPPRVVPKTSSGKLRRGTCRALYQRGELTRARSTRWQILRLAAGTIMPRLRRAGRWLGERAYAVYFWTLFGMLAPVAFLAAVAPRRQETRRWLVGKSISAFFRAVGVRLAIDALDDLASPPSIVVANHASYLDGLILAALLPPRYAFVAKAELRNNPFTRIALGRLGTELVERSDAERGAADAERLDSVLARGQSLVFFPEGTLRRAHGTFPYRMGAFLLAARERLPVNPVAISGTRTVLRGDQWFPRHGAIRVTVLPALAARDDGWESAVALREEARRQLARATGEPEVSDR